MAAISTPALHPARLALRLGGLLLGLCALAACGKREPDTAATAPSAAPATADAARASELRATAKDAYIWGFPIVEGYKTLYQQAVDKGGPNFHAGLNEIGNVSSVATPKDTAIITPNSDTPYSFLWMDLRAEPVVISVPAIDANRYFSVQLIDLYTYNFAYINRAATDGKASVFMVAGPDWQGETPKGVRQVFRAETQLAYGLFRTQLISPSDLDNVKRLQAQYKVQPLSAFLGTPAPPQAPAITFPPYDPEKASGLGFFSYLNFLLQFAPTVDSEAALRQRFAGIGIEPGKPLDAAALPPADREAITAGIADANQALEQFVATEVNTGKVSSADMFGTRAALKDNYLYRFAGAKLGIYGNSASEADYQSYFVDAQHKPADGSQHDYVLRFAKDQLPPTNAFWSVTLYDGKSKLLVDNPLDRYLINSAMLPTLKRDADGGLTLYIQHGSPGTDKESNWLPAPAGPFYLILRNYSPGQAVLDRSWQKPALTAVERTPG
ncbi:DUF1254 domain-containing protein [Stenotrophomonas sp. AB1(2024)]|uniref:DUF1254 domain-containing protein n=1 Tax=Stenotrophomonas sp. AB1(2024) TaxID=3132215 RepID=UPI0030A99772